MLELNLEKFDFMRNSHDNMAHVTIIFNTIDYFYRNSLIGVDFKFVGQQSNEST